MALYPENSAIISSGSFSKINGPSALRGGECKVCIIIQYMYIGNLAAVWSFEGFALGVYAKQL